LSVALLPPPGHDPPSGSFHLTPIGVVAPVLIALSSL
jgi:hypothetical protein